MAEDTRSTNDEAADPRKVSTLAERRPRLTTLPSAPDVPDRAPPDVQPVRKRQARPPLVNISIKAPLPVKEAFWAYHEQGKFPTKWHALEALMLQAGVEVAEFDG